MLLILLLISDILVVDELIYFKKEKQKVCVAPDEWGRLLKSY